MFVTPFYAYLPILYPTLVEEKVAYAEIVTSIGFTVGPILGSVLYEYGGYLTPFFVFSAFSFSFAVAMPLFYKHLQVNDEADVQNI